MSQGSRGGTPGWVVFGGLVAIGFGVVVARSNPLGVAVAVGSITVGWTVAAWWCWRREEQTHPVPAAEYFAAVWALAYLSVLVMPAAARGVNWADAMLLLPPVSLVPLVARVALGDDGDPDGRARSVAYQLHRVCGWTLTALGSLFVVSLFFIFVAPLSLIPGLLNVYAASRYRLARSSGSAPSVSRSR